MARSMSSLSRRQALRLGAAASALPLVHIRTAGAAGALKVALWDHWVPQGNAVMKKQVETWADMNHVAVETDFITSSGGKLEMTATAEAQARTGHDVYTFFNWDVQNLQQRLAPVDEVVHALVAKHGAVDPVAEYLGTVEGHWVAVPTSSGSHLQTPCARISWMKAHGFDPTMAYPMQPGHTKLQDEWTWERFLTLANEAKKTGMTFALGCGGPIDDDATNMQGALFKSFGADLVDKKGNILLDSPEVHAAMEYCERLVKAMPPDAESYDDASNNRALISGKSALIFNPSSAWAVAKRDAPQVAEDCWTFSAPAGPRGRFVPISFFFWGVWNFSKNQSAGKELIAYLMDRPQVEARENAVAGFDIPPFAGMLDFKIWETVAPPHGTMYNYPIRPWHHARSSLTGSEAAPAVGVQIYQSGMHPGMVSRLKSGQSIKQVLSWANNQLEGFMQAR